MGQAWMSNGIVLQMSVPYSAVSLDDMNVRETDLAYIDANSERTTKVAATPAQTKRYPYTAPAGPPL